MTGTAVKPGSYEGIWKVASTLAQAKLDHVNAVPMRWLHSNLYKLDVLHSDCALSGALWTIEQHHMVKQMRLQLAAAVSKLLWCRLRMALA